MAFHGDQLRYALPTETRTSVASGQIAHSSSWSHRHEDESTDMTQIGVKFKHSEFNLVLVLSIYK